MNGNPLRWGILVGIIVCVVAVLSSLPTTPEAAYSAPEAQATSTSTPGPAVCSLGGVALYCPHAPNGNNLLGISLESGSVSVAVPTLQAVQGRIGATTPVAGVNPVLVGVQDYSTNLQPLHVAPPATGDNAGDLRLQTSAFVQGQSGSTMVNIQANATTGALLVQGSTPVATWTVQPAPYGVGTTVPVSGFPTPLPTWTAQPLLAVGTPLVADSAGRLNTVPYVINGSGAVDQVQGGRFLTTPVATATGFQNVLAGGVTRLTPVTMTNAQVANLSLDSNGNLSVAQGVALPAGENVLGKVGGNTLHPSANPALSVAASYVTGDYVGTSATPWSWTGCRTSGGTGQLQSVTVVDKAIQSVAGELWLFDRSVTVPNDSAAWTITDADAQFLLGVVPVNTYYASAANSVASVTGVGMTLWCNGSSTIYGAWVTRGSPSYASGDLTVVLGISAD